MPFQFKTHGELTLLASNHGGNDKFYAKKGSMVAYKGQFKFDKVLLDPNGGGMVKSVLNHVSRRLTGENMELMEVKGSGEVYLADEAQHVTIIDLGPNDQLSVESENLLAFNDATQYGVRFIGVGVISQKGLFTSKLTAKAHGSQVAVKSDGNPIMLQTPCVVDPDAVVCWSGPDPSFKMGLSWKTFVGQTSGESYMLEFKEHGHLVLIQPSERLSGLKVGIDDNRYSPQEQNNPMQGSFQNMQQMGQQMGQGQGQGGIVGSIGNMLNNMNNNR